MEPDLFAPFYKTYREMPPRFGLEIEGLIKEKKRFDFK